MKSLSIFAVFAVVSLSNYARSSYVATTYSNKDCQFSNWYGRIPSYPNTCVRMYWSGAAWWKSSSPWCFHSDGSWDYCKTYTWEMEFAEQNHLIKSESRRKEYYFEYGYSGTTYEDARRTCRRKGAGWDVASFQAKPSYGKDRKFATSGQVYDKSVANIVKALWPLIETWDAFWVRNAEGSNSCLDFYRWQRRSTCNQPMGSDCYESDPSTFMQKRCDQEKSFVCERSL